MRFFYSFILLVSYCSLMAQKSPQQSDSKQKSSIIELVNIKASTLATPTRGGTGVPMKNAPILSSHNSTFKVKTVTEDGMPSLIRGALPADMASSRSKEQQIFAYLEAVKTPIQVQNPSEEFQIMEQLEDEVGKSHTKLQQTYQGLKVYGGEAWLHTDKKGTIDLFSGRNYPSPQLSTITPTIDKDNALNIARTDVAQHTTVNPMNTQQSPLLKHLEDKAELVVYHVDQDLAQEHLAWSLKIHPNRVSHWNYFIDAHTGEVLNHHTTLCQLYHGIGMDKEDTHHQEAETVQDLAIATGNRAFFDGPETTQATDINGQTQTVNSYSTDGTNFLIDTSKPMYNTRTSRLPDDPVGAIWTLDARNSSPSARSFQPHHVTSNSTAWNDALAVSAHTNASITYDYFLEKHGRNSVNDRGINIVSFINVADENGQSMENAFWDGQYIYYGNGGRAFKPLAGALDVAGHEISHGVIQNTANLEYQGESGAMNEAIADIFAVLIEDDDLKIGEDVVNRQQFPSGALRDIQNPNNGGSRLGDPGWQPRTTAEQYFGREDNGGVHINSGIINHAFYLYLVDEQLGEINANAEKIGKIYYKALTNYLNSRSNFQHLRESVILSARDLHGAESEEVRAADRAFSAVGITRPAVASIIGTAAPDEEDAPEEIEENLGRDFIIYTDADSTRLYIADGTGTFQVSTQPIGVNSRPSATDDGTRIIFIAGDNTLREVKINWETSTISEDVIDENPIWRNACISRDGRRLAAVTLETTESDLDNRIYVYDLFNGDGRDFELYNPTYTEGITTGTVQYADALEFDFTGESVMYDALNSISGAFGDSELSYWDIGFLKVWENDINNWEEDTENNIRKLYSGLPEDDSVGNPTFSKNSPDVIAFDYITNFNTNLAENQYFLLGANLFTGDLDTILQNGQLNYPSYSRTDEEIIFNASTSSNQPIIAKVRLADNKIKGASNADILVNETHGAQLGVWFSNGDRVLDINTSTDDLALSLDELMIKPNPFTNGLNIEFTTDKKTDFQIEVIDLLGKQVYSSKRAVINGQNQFQIDLPFLQAGTYILSLKSEEGVLSRKVVKL